MNTSEMISETNYIQSLPRRSPKEEIQFVLCQWILPCFFEKAMLLINEIILLRTEVQPMRPLNMLSMKFDGSNIIFSNDISLSISISTKSSLVSLALAISSILLPPTHHPCLSTTKQIVDRSCITKVLLYPPLVTQNAQGKYRYIQVDLHLQRRHFPFQNLQQVLIIVVFKVKRI